MLRTIVVGAGRISLSHIPHLMMHRQLDVVAVVEKSWVLRAVMRKLLNVKIYKSAAQINLDDYDLVFLLTPPGSHFNLAEGFISNKKHVFIEKPLCLNPKDSRRLLALAEKNQVQVSVGYVYRFHPIFMKLREIIADEAYGTPVNAKITMLGNVVNADSKMTWRSSGLGAGCLYDYGCHVIDLSLFLFGSAVSYKCESKESVFSLGVIDRFTGSLRYENHKKLNAEIECDWANKNARKASLSVLIETATHSIFTDGQTIQVTGMSDDYISIKDLDTNVAYYLRGEEFQLQLDHLLFSITSGLTNTSNNEHAASVDEIIENFHEASV